MFLSGRSLINVGSTKVFHLVRLLAECNFHLLKKLARKSKHSSLFDRSISVEDFLFNFEIC
jgi:hypothetical protein